MHWFCGQENKLALAGILPSDENSQTVGQRPICGVPVHVTRLRSRTSDRQASQRIPSLRVPRFSGLMPAKWVLGLHADTIEA
jgi:hypothetical protein